MRVLEFRISFVDYLIDIQDMGDITTTTIDLQASIFYMHLICLSNIHRRKYIFSPYILHFFHFSSYILFLPLLVPKPINA